MDVDEIGSSNGKHSPLSSFDGHNINEEEDNKKKIKLSELWERKIMPLLRCMNEIDQLYRKSDEVVSNALKDKVHLLFVCFYLPPEIIDHFEFDPVYPQDFLTTCLDLYSYRDDFELVLVTNMNADDPTSDSLFHDCMFGFPSSSLVVPLHDSQRRTFICDLLLELEPEHEPEPEPVGFTFKCLFVNVAAKTLYVGHPASLCSFVGHLKELVRNSSFDALRSYNRLVKYAWPIDSSCLPLIRSCPIARIFHNVKPEYPDDINAMVSDLPPIQIGQTLDVKFLLSAGGGSNELDYLARKGGEQVELGKAIQDKYTMICCFHAPVFREEWRSDMFQSLINTCSELYAQRMDFEMVVVVKMKRLADYEQVFNHFLSGLPSSCFVIPFKFSKHRDFICKYLKLHDKVQCLLLDNKGTDMKKNILLHGYDFAKSYGADAFPFTDEKLEKLEAHDAAWRSSPTNDLVELLRCKPTDVLNKTNAEDGCETVTISDLVKKDVVGLFLCGLGNYIPKLQEVYEQCKTQQKPFEILLVYMPFMDCLDPQNHKLYVDNLLQKHKLSLWYMPFDNSVSHKLNRLAGNFTKDVLVIFRAQDAFCDPLGGKVLRSGGIDAYPFTRKQLVEREFNNLKSLTLEKLLVYKTRTSLLKGNKVTTVADLKGKKIILWISSLSLCHFNLSFYHKLLIWYETNRAKNPDFEVVFVRGHKSTTSDSDYELAEVMPWFVCPFNADHSASIAEKLSPKLRLGSDTLFEFGIHGEVCSLRAEYLLDIGVDESGKIPFGSSNLHRDVIKYLRHLYGEFMRREIN